MLLQLRKHLSEADVRAFTDLARELGYRVKRLEGELVRLEGVGAPEHRSRLEDCYAVAAVLDAGSARELFQRVPGQPDTLVAAGEARFGAGSVSMIAGPCAIETYDATLSI